MPTQPDIVPPARAAARPLPWECCVVLFTLATGCDVDYFAHLVGGEIDVLFRSEPVAVALADPSLSEVERERLRLVQDVRRFGIDSIGLVETDAYTVFDPNGTEPSAYVLSASARDGLSPYTWIFPFAGEVAYKGFFDLERAKREAQALRDQGFDVLLGTADGFSTLGILPDPIRESNLSLDEIDLAELILHEMTHNTVYKPSDTNFIEAMATFVGRSAALRYFRRTRGDEDPTTQLARERFEDKAVIDEFVARLYGDAAAYYAESAAAGLSTDAIITGRDAVFAGSLASYDVEFEPRLHDPARWSRLGDLQLNNAVILAGVRYQGGLGVFNNVLETLDGNFAATLQVFAEAAVADDGFAYLDAWSPE